MVPVNPGFNIRKNFSKTDPQIGHPLSKVSSGLFSAEKSF